MTFFSVKRYSIQAGDICLVKQKSGFGNKFVCVFVTKCCCYIADDYNDDDGNENEARVEFSNDTVLTNKPHKNTMSN